MRTEQFAASSAWLFLHLKIGLLFCSSDLESKLHGSVERALPVSVCANLTGAVGWELGGVLHAGGVHPLQTWESPHGISSSNPTKSACRIESTLHKNWHVCACMHLYTGRIPHLLFYASSNAQRQVFVKTVGAVLRGESA